MDIPLEELDNEKRFLVKLQIELYNLASRVMTAEKEREYNEYMQERIEKIRKILGKEHGKIYEENKEIFRF